MSGGLTLGQSWHSNHDRDPFGSPPGGAPWELDPTCFVSTIGADQLTSTATTRPPP